MSIQAKVEEILEDIKKYSPHPEKVKLIAVTKYSYLNYCNNLSNKKNSYI